MQFVVFNELPTVSDHALFSCPHNNHYVHNIVYVFDNKLLHALTPDCLPKSSLDGKMVNNVMLPVKIIAMKAYKGLFKKLFLYLLSITDITPDLLSVGCRIIWKAILA
jgi:hypothetical protein